jgi:hypothetical protein
MVTIDTLARYPLKNRCSLHAQQQNVKKRRRSSYGDFNSLFVRTAPHRTAGNCKQLVHDDNIRFLWLVRYSTEITSIGY